MTTAYPIKQTTLDLLKEFHSKFNCYTQHEPHIPNLDEPERVHLKMIASMLRQAGYEAWRAAKEHNHGIGRQAMFTRSQLMIEELAEFVEALASGDVAHTLKELNDVQYVVDGTYLSLGFGPIKEDSFAEVHRSNMAKLGPNGHPITNAAGRVVKPPGWTPPDMEQFVRKSEED